MVALAGSSILAAIFALSDRVFGEYRLNPVRIHREEFPCASPASLLLLCWRRPSLLCRHRPLFGARLRRSASRSPLRRRNFPNMTNRQFPPTAISGLQGTGPGAATIIIGCRAHGSNRRKPGCCGLRDIGDGVTVTIDGVEDTGDLISAFMAALLMGSAMTAKAMRAPIGTMARSFTIVASPISARSTSPTSMKEMSSTGPRTG
jgi:hypothetical protein